MTENWKELPHYGLEVSDRGNVKRNGQTVVARLGHYGYPRVSVLGRAHYVHRLVAEAFCEKPAGCSIVDHIDSQPHNNHFSNLAWVTPEQNTRKAHLLRKETIGTPTTKKLPADGTTFLSVRTYLSEKDSWEEAARKAGFNKVSTWAKKILNDAVDKV